MACPIIIDNLYRPLEVLHFVTSCKEVVEINGVETLSFKLPYARSMYLANEAVVQIENRVYKVKSRKDVKSGSIYETEVYCEAAFYDLAFTKKVMPRVFENERASNPIRYALDDTGWDLGEVDIEVERTFEVTEENALSLLRTIQNLYGGDLIFDSQSKRVSLMRQSGKKTGALFSYQKNMQSVERTTDTTGLITRLYAYGQEGLTFSSLNDGRPYIEDFTYSGDVRTSVLDLSSFTDPSQMLEYTKMRMAEYSKPKVSYVMKVIDLSKLLDFSHESFDIGDEVMVYDEDFALDLKTRVVRLERDHLEPWNTVIELSSKLRELGSYDAKREREQVVRDQQNKERLEELAQNQTKTIDTFEAWVKSQKDLTDLMAHGQGYYTTIKEDPKGGIITYIHDRPLLIDSTYVMMRNATGEAWSNDGGQTWNSGRDADGQMLVKVLSAIGINAEWINVGGDPLNDVVSDLQRDKVYKVDLISTNGSISTSKDWTSKLIARVYHGATDVTDDIDANRFRWFRTSRDPDGDALWNQSFAGGRKEITITSKDAAVKATFTCEILGG